jgi:hypothetical protein
MSKLQGMEIESGSVSWETGGNRDSSRPNN